MTSTASLDLAASPDAEERHAEPILTVHELQLEQAAARFAIRREQSPYIGMSFANIAREPLADPKPCSRSALMVTPVVTRSDALAGLALDESCEDRELTARVLRDLRNLQAD